MEYQIVNDINKIKSYIRKYNYCVNCPFTPKYPKLHHLSTFVYLDDYYSDEENEKRYNEYMESSKLLDSYIELCRKENGKNPVCIAISHFNYWEIAYELYDNLIIKTSKKEYYIIKSYKKYFNKL